MYGGISDEDLEKFLRQFTHGHDEVEALEPSPYEPPLTKEELWEKQYDEERGIVWTRHKK